MFDSRDLRRTLKKTVHAFDVVYIAAWFMWLGITAAAICRGAKVPVIAGTHGGFTDVAMKKSRLVKKLFRELFLKRAFRNVAAFRVTSTMEKVCSMRWLRERPCIVVPNAVEPEAFYPCPDRHDEFRRQYGIPSGARVLITVTLFDWMKRVDLLMDCLARFASWRLVLVGDDRKGTAPALKQHARAVGVAERVIWTGHLEGDSLRMALSASDLFALISETENFGNVVVEAMMCGVPVLISKQVGVAEFIGDLPFVSIVENSVESIARSVLYFERTWISDVLQTSRIRESAIQRFSPESVAERFMSSLQGILYQTPQLQRDSRGN